MVTEEGEKVKVPPGLTVTVTVAPLALLRQRAKPVATTVATAAMRSERVRIPSSDFLVVRVVLLIWALWVFMSGF
jgi:hypothetical protein